MDAKSRQQKSLLSSEKKEKKKPIVKPTEKKKLTYKEKIEYESLMPEIESLEEEKGMLENKIGAGEVNYEEIEKLSVRIGEVINLIDDKTLRWMELDEYVN